MALITVLNVIHRFACMYVCKEITGKMASPHDGREDEDDEEEKLEKMRQELLERKKAVFERTKEADKELLEIRQKETAIQERQQRIKAEKIELRQIRHELERVKSENAKLKGSQKNSGRKIERLEAELREKIALCEREHGGAVDVNEMKEELDTLRHRNVEQSASLRELKDAVQRITSYSHIQQKEKEQALRQVDSLKDDIAALRQISAETQGRQLNEIGSTSFAEKQQQQQRTGKANTFLFLATCVIGLHV